MPPGLARKHKGVYRHTSLKRTRSRVRPLALAGGTTVVPSVLTPVYSRTKSRIPTLPPSEVLRSSPHGTKRRGQVANSLRSRARTAPTARNSGAIEGPTVTERTSPSCLRETLSLLLGSWKDFPIVATAQGHLLTSPQHPFCALSD